MRDFLADAAQTDPDAPALVLSYFAHLGGHYARYSFGRLNKIVALLALRLAASGVKPGDRVGVLADNAQRTIEIMHALWRIGALVVPLNTRWTPDEIGYALDAADVMLLLCDSAHEANARASAAGRPLFTLTPSARSLVSSLPDMDDFAGSVADYEARDLDRDRVAAILFTSGTTGRPKGAQLTFGNFHASALASRQRIGTTARDRWLLSLPLYHVGGLAMLVRACIDRSALVLMTPTRDTDDIARAVAQERVTLVSLVPTQLYRLLESGFTAPPSLRLMLLGGAAAPVDLLRRCCEAGLPIAVTYGMTEAASQVTTMLPDEVCRKPGSVGVALMGTALRIMDAHDQAVEPGTIGTIRVAGDTVMRGYLGAEAIDGWLDTGDLGYLDADGDLWLVQRRTDLIVSGGENVYPSEVEAALRSHPDVLDACVVGLPDPEWGQRVAALIVRRDDSTLDAATLIAFSRQILAGYKQPRVIAFASELPLTASGKVRRADVSALLQKHGGAS
ncbi:MAG: o-succinylbenzoate--CoA ligase [Chloroflexota bacterium]|nr:o-succinylbenzoate--CoA ligase [Chloroflexota bacterium]